MFQLEIGRRGSKSRNSSTTLSAARVIDHAQTPAGDEKHFRCGLPGAHRELSASKNDALSSESEQND